MEGLCPHDKIETAFCEKCSEADMVNLEKTRDYEDREALCQHGQHPGFCIDCAYSVDTHKIQLERCLRGIKTALSILTDLMDEEKRRGPTHNQNQRVRSLPCGEEARGRLSNGPKPDKESKQAGLGMRELS